MATEATTLRGTPAEGEGRERTIGELWRAALAEDRAAPAYLVQHEGDWMPVTWADAARRVDELANGFISHGLRKGDAFAILATTRLEWALVDFALARIGVVVIPVYPTSSPADCAYVLEHSEAVGIVLEDEEQRTRIESQLAAAPRLEHVFTFADLEELGARGREHAAAHPSSLAETAGAVHEDDLLTIVYTSGTTGPPKGCMMLHRNYVAVVDMLQEAGGLNEPGDLNLLFLPLAHTYAQLVLYGALGIGFTVAFCPSIERVPEAIQGVRPTAMPSVPRVYEKIHAAVLAQFDAATGTKRKLIDWSLRVGRRASALRQKGRPLPPLLALQHRLANRLVYSKVKAKLGGRLRYGVSGAAPLSVEILEFFHTLDILILEGYGLTESASGCSVNRPDAFRFGTVGPPLPGVEIKIEDDGEILIRGDNVFAGYYKDEEATRAALGADRWLRTGDVGVLEDGYLAITDRKKDLIVTAGGKNISPQNLENALKSSKYVSQAVAVGDRRPYVAVLITLDEQEIRAWAKERGLDGTVPDLTRTEEVRELLQGLVDEVNRERTRFEQIKRFAVLPQDFSAERDEITPTMKLKRRVITERYGAEIDALYEG